MRIDRGRTAFNIETTGPQNAPGIVFLHGFLGSADDWLPVAEELSDSYRCFLVDLPGHGRTTAGSDDEFRFGTVVRNLSGLIGHLPASRLHLAGYSMGGRIALALLLSTPHLFRSAAIISASPGLRDETSRCERRKHDDRLAGRLEENFEEFLEFWYSLPLFAPLRASASFDAVLDARRRNSPHLLAMALQGMSTGRQPSCWEQLPQNRLPVRFLAGQKDTKYVEIGRQMVNLCPGSSLDILPGCGHTPQLEHRRLFTERLLNFFNMIDHHDL
ncbi:MAG: 2-succinyl-6-hydroxy-2,4-cyclohexadiene-1-carboxylate synthase [Prosthecochloris sp.]|nr:2-succinyl-6-hydroxy-2,4-cyclohexadiene-1-carboxylate synthase [Prosthecochloris sp.]